MSFIDDLIKHNKSFASRDFTGMLPLKPARELAIVTCMDSRMAVFKILGLEPGEAHIIRNAGGVVTNDVIRSLLLSQRMMGTREVMIIQHTDCGLMRVSEDKIREELEHETGMSPPFPMEAFRDPQTNVRQSIRRLHLSPFVRHNEQIRGFVYSVETGLLSEVRVEDSARADS
jgi:carbonic anhydrase